MSDPNMDEAAVDSPADADSGVGTPESKLNMGTTTVGGPVSTDDDDDRMAAEDPGTLAPGESD
jgi:hypothetical protein